MKGEVGKALCAELRQEKRINDFVESALSDTVLTCSCRRVDAWRCAVDQNLRTVACTCPCHKRQGK